MSCDRPDPRKQILDLIRVRGPQPTSQLASCLGITGNAVRRRLLALEAEGLLSKENRRGNVGRPSQVWDLTRDGRRAFHDAHAELCVRLMVGVREMFGEAGLRAVLEVLTREDAGRVAALLDRVPSVEARVRALVQLRRDQGYMAEYGWDPDRQEHLLVEHHCPVEDAARSCDSVCEHELRFLGQALGRDLDVVRREHLLDGDRRCVYGFRAPGALEV